ncbi:hypothetical protein [Sporolactobacillus putidus]|uniref:hypothetical protein n=1 Tax=Sporolactobacillus putidus TaxID=492735 RepID=UPI004032C71B
MVDYGPQIQLTGTGKKAKVLARIQFETMEEALCKILGFGSQAEVIQPAELRVKISEHIKKLYRLYK